MKDTFLSVSISGTIVSVVVACIMAGISILLGKEWEYMLLFGTTVVSTVVAFASLEFPCNNFLGWLLGTLCCAFFTTFTYLLYVLIMLSLGYYHDDGILFHTDTILTLLEACGWGSLLYLVV